MGAMRPETIFILAVAVAAVVIVLAIRKTRRQGKRSDNAADLDVSEVDWPDWW
jgi:hypothetical protein